MPQRPAVGRNGRGSDPSRRVPRRRSSPSRTRCARTRACCRAAAAPSRRSRRRAEGVVPLVVSGPARDRRVRPGRADDHGPGAGTPVRVVQQALAAHGQHLPFDPPLARGGATLGGVVAAGTSGPGRFRHGGVRDFIIGARFVDGAGALVGGAGARGQERRRLRPAAPARRLAGPPRRADRGRVQGLPGAAAVGRRCVSRRRRLDATLAACAAAQPASTSRRSTSSRRARCSCASAARRRRSSPAARGSARTLGLPARALLGAPEAALWTDARELDLDAARRPSLVRVALTPRAAASSIRRSTAPRLRRYSARRGDRLAGVAWPTLARGARRDPAHRGR